MRTLLDEGVFDWARVLGHRQITEVYLLSLAARHGGRSVMFDRRIVFDAAKGVRPENLEIVA